MVSLFFLLFCTFWLSRPFRVWSLSQLRAAVAITHRRRNWRASISFGSPILLWRASCLRAILLAPDRLRVLRVHVDPWYHLSSTSYARDASWTSTI